MFKDLLGQKRTLVHDAIDEVVTMLERAESMFGLVCGKLLENGVDVDIGQSDEDINMGERMVRRMVFQHLMVNPHQDLPASLSLISIVHDVERIGDYAKSLLELNQWLNLCAAEGCYCAMCREIHGEIMPFFGLTLKALRDSAPDAAREVMEKHLEVKKRTDDLLKAAMEDEDAGRDAVLFTLTSRYLRRVSGHLSNVSSSVVNPLDQLAARAEEA